MGNFFMALVLYLDASILISVYFFQIRGKQEQLLKVRNFLPPQAQEPEIFLLEKLMATAANADSKLSEGKYKLYRFYEIKKMLNGKNLKITLESAFAYHANYDKKSILYYYYQSSKQVRFNKPLPTTIIFSDKA